MQVRTEPMHTVNLSHGAYRCIRNTLLSPWYLCVTQWISGNWAGCGSARKGSRPTSKKNQKNEHELSRHGPLVVAIFVAVAFALPAVAQATDAFPLRPPDRSSPRASLEGFTKIMDEAYQGFVGVLTEYAASGRLYLSQEESRRQREILGSAPKAVQYLDLSHISAALRDAVAIERILQLKEILDRIALPAPDAIPDQAAVARTGAKRWRLPDTEIDLV